MSRLASITAAASRSIGAATRLLRPTDFDADKGRVDPVDIATAPGTAAGSLRVSADGRRLYVATHGPSGGRSVRDEPEELLTPPM
jgi:hypothetical protein